MKTVLRVIPSTKGVGYIDIPNPYNMTPRKGDHVVYEEVCYIVSYVEFNFDNNTLYVIVINN